MPTSMEVTKVCLSVASGGAGRWLTTMSRADPPREVVEDGATRLEQPETGEQLARGVAVAVPAEEDATVTESVSGTGIASGDEAVDRDGQ
jgi:hypothetical protein